MTLWTIVSCTENDKPQLVEVCKQQWTQGESRNLPRMVVSNIESAYTFEQYVEDSWRQMVLAKVDETVIGFVYWNDAEVMGLGVLPSWWRRGVGRSLMAYVEHVLRDQQIPMVRLEVYDLNSDAVQFYKSLGYTVTDSFVNNDWGEPLTTLVMTKAL